MSQKLEVLEKLGELMDSKITINGDVIVNYSEAKKELHNLQF